MRDLVFLDGLDIGSAEGVVGRQFIHITAIGGVEYSPIITLNGLFVRCAVEEVHKLYDVAVGLEHLTVLGGYQPRTRPKRHDTVFKGRRKEFACLNKGGTTIHLLQRPQSRDVDADKMVTGVEIFVRSYGLGLAGVYLKLQSAQRKTGEVEESAEPIGNKGAPNAFDIVTFVQLGFEIKAGIVVNFKVDSTLDIKLLHVFGCQDKKHKVNGFFWLCYRFGNAA